MKSKNVWLCDDKTLGDNCETYNKNYGCFGNCNMDSYIVGNGVRGLCGTDEWFDHQMNINPKEKDFIKKMKILLEMLKQTDL
jgi:hypothetical protein